MRLIKSQNPNLDIRFVFSNAKTKIGKNQKQLMASGVKCLSFHTIVSIQQNKHSQQNG